MTCINLVNVLVLFQYKTSDTSPYNKRNPGILHEIPGFVDEVIKWLGTGRLFRGNSGLFPPFRQTAARAPALQASPWAFLSRFGGAWPDFGPCHTLTPIPEVSNASFRAAVWRRSRCVPENRRPSVPNRHPRNNPKFTERGTGPLAMLKWYPARSVRGFGLTERGNVP